MNKRDRITEAHIEQFCVYLYNNGLTATQLAKSPEFTDIKTAVMTFCSKSGHTISPSCRKLMNRLGIKDIQGSFTIHYDATTGQKSVIEK